MNNQKTFNKKLSIILKWLDSDFIQFSKVYNHYKMMLEKKYQNHFDIYFTKLIDNWVQLTKVEYMHVLTINEKIDKLEIQGLQFL